MPQGFVHFQSLSKARVGLQHEKLPDADTAAEKKAYWREQLNVLKEVLGGE